VTSLIHNGWTFRHTRVNTRGVSLVIAVVVVDLAIGGARARGDLMLHDPINGADKLTPVDLEAYFEPDAAARFLQERGAESPGRYFGYAPYLDRLAWPYTTRFIDPATASLEVDNRALPLGLQDVQGYDAAHLQRYDTYLLILNGRTQNYHDAEVFWGGLNSPLLDLLNVRYVVVPPSDRLDMVDRDALERFNETVYADSQVRVLANPSALPRGWIVHTATQMAPTEALQAIDGGRVQARSVALLEEPPPALAVAHDPAADRADVTVDDAERVVVETSSAASGMLVLSEIYYPAWHAFVDDRPVHVYVADGVLRAVALPAGQHHVELRFESTTLTAGAVISAASIVALATLLVGGWMVEFSHGRRRRWWA
jgi:hypothetical protein